MSLIKFLKETHKKQLPPKLSEKELAEELLALEIQARYLVKKEFQNFSLPPNSLDYKIVLEGKVAHELKLENIQEVQEFKNAAAKYFANLNTQAANEKRRLKRWEYLDQSLDALIGLGAIEKPTYEHFEAAKDNLANLILADGIEAKFNTSIKVPQCVEAIKKISIVTLQYGEIGAKIGEYLHNKLEKLGDLSAVGKEYSEQIDLGLMAASFFENFFVERKQLGNTYVYNVNVSQPSFKELEELGLIKTEKAEEPAELEEKPQKEKKGILQEQKKPAQVLEKRVYVVDEFAISSVYFGLKSPFDTYKTLEAATDVSINNRFSTQEITKLINILHVPSTTVLTTAESLFNLYHSPGLSDASFKEVYRRAEQVRKQAGSESQATCRVSFLERILKLVNAIYQKIVRQQPADLLC